MKIGMMNNPGKNLSDEIRFALDHKFDFLDLTLEPPGAMLNSSDDIALLKECVGSLELVGHTAWYLPIDFPYKSIQDAVILDLGRQFELFANLGITKVTLHFKFSYPHRFFSYQEKLECWTIALRPLCELAENTGLTLMLENTINTREARRLMKDLFKRCQNLQFHLDVGHTNLNVASNVCDDYLRLFKNRLHHIHLSDNFGGSNDLHLPLGAGSIPWDKIVKMIQRTGYNNTITLEVFSPNRRYLLLSREILRDLWEKHSN